MKRVKPSKIIFIILSIALSLILVSALLFIHYYPKEEILRLITDQAEKTLKRRLTIDKLNYGLDGIILKKVCIYDGLTPDDELLLSAKEARIRFSILPLINKQLIIHKIIINNLKLNITYDEEKFNLDNLINDLKSNGESSVETKVSYITLNDAEITLVSSPEKLKNLIGQYIFSGTVSIINKRKLLIKNCKLKFPDDRGTMYPEMDISITDNDFEINSDVRLQKFSFVWLYKFHETLSLPYVDFTGKITNLKITKIGLEGTADGISTLTNSKLLNVQGSWKASFSKKKVSLINLAGKIDNSKFFINNFRFNTKGVKYKIHITDIDINVSDFKPILTFLPSKLFGRVSGNILYENNIYNGNFNLKNVGYNKQAETVSKINTDIIIKNNTFYKENVPGLIYNQPCLISIATTDKNFNKIALNISAKELIFRKNKDKISEYTSTSTDLKFEIAGRIDIDNLYIKDYQFSDFALNYSIINKNLIINRTNSRFMGGNITAKGSVDISIDSPDAYFSIQFNKIKVHSLTSQSDNFSGRLFGIAAGKANIRFKLKDDMEIYDSLDGKIEFSIDNGKLVNTGIQKGLGIWLSELKYKLKDLEFNKIYGNFKISGGNCFVNSILFNAPDIRLKMNGYFGRPVNDDAKIPGDMKIDLEFNNDFIKDIRNVADAYRWLAKIFTQPNLVKKGEWYYMKFQDKGSDITDSNNIKPL